MSVKGGLSSSHCPPPACWLCRASSLLSSSCECRYACIRGCAEMVLNIRACIARGCVQGWSSARVVVHMGVQRDVVHACVCMHEHGRVHQGLCTRPFVLSHFCVPVDGVRTYSCARMHLLVCVNAQVCVGKSLHLGVWFCTHPCTQMRMQGSSGDL